MELITPDLAPYIVFDPEGHWLWKGARSGGYGVVRRKGRNYLVHRLLWERANGPIPLGLVFRHANGCPRNCVRPDHARPPGTNADNLADAIEDGRHYGGRTHCKYGHEYTPETTHLFGPQRNWRRCLICRPIVGTLKRSHCRKGHEYVPENIHHYADGRRECLICRNNRPSKQRATATEGHD